MKIDRLIAAFAFTAAIAVPPICAQTKPATQSAQPAAQASGPIPDSKMALIYSEAFQDPKTGIARFNALVNTLNGEFKPKEKEISDLQQKAQQLNDDIEKTKNVADPKATQQKMDQLEQIQKDLKRKGEDAQALYNKRQVEIVAPLQEDIAEALEAYA